MSTAFLVDSLLHAQRAQSYSESLSEMLLSRGQTVGEPADRDRDRDRQEAEHSSELLCNCNCAKRGYKCDKCRENRAESVDSIEEMEMEMEDDEDDDDDEIVAEIDSIETPHLDLDEDLDDDLDMQSRREAIKLPKLEPKLEPSTNTSSGTTILKDNNSKPILKFSVSAILGDTREGVRVRNGKKKHHRRNNKRILKSWNDITLIRW